MTSSPVSTETRGDLAIITLDDGKANALSFDLLAGLDEALDSAFAGSKAVAIIGREGKFSAGFDLKIMTGDIADAQRLLATGADIALKILTAPIPTILGVTGHALAMGGILCTVGDYRIGAVGPFKLGLNEVAIGMPVPNFAVELCRDRLSPLWFNRCVQLATVVSPEDAVPAGFLDELVAPEAVADRAIELGTMLAEALHPAAFKATRTNLKRDLLTTVERVTEYDRGTFEVHQ